MLRTINPRTGRPFEARASEILSDYGDHAAIPDSIQRLLDKAAALPGSSGPHASSVGWRDVLTPRRVLTSDGAQVLNTTTETIMVPDYTFAADTLEPGDVFKYTIFFDISTVITTPGTITFRLRWGGAAGVSLAASAAYAPDPTAASTDLVGAIQWYFVCRAVGATGSAYAFGILDLTDSDDASATTIAANLNARMIPQTSAAAVSIDTTTAKALSPTVQFSVSTATTQLTSLLAILESLN